MTYGLKIDTGTTATSSDISQLNSNSQNTYAFGNFSTIPSDGKITLGSNEALFVKLSKPSSSDNFKHYALQKLTNQTSTHRIVEINHDTGAVVGSGSGEMCIVSDMSETLTSTFLTNSNQDYGLQVKNSDETIILDTRGFGDGGNLTTLTMIEPMNKLGVGADFSQGDSIISGSLGSNDNAKLASFNENPFILFDWAGTTVFNNQVTMVNTIVVANQYRLRAAGVIRTDLDPMDGYFFGSFVNLPQIGGGTLRLYLVNSYNILIGKKFT